MTESKSRRQRGDGAITRKKTSAGCRFYASVMEDDGHGGRRRRGIGGYETLSAAQTALRGQRTNQDRGSYVSPDKETVMHYATRWLEDSKPTHRPGTHLTYEKLIRLHVLPALGSKGIQKLAPQDVKSLQAKLLAAGLAPGTVRLIRVVFAKVLNDAVADGTITKNVGRGIAVPRNEDDKASVKKAWSAEQSATFLAHERESDLYPLWRFMLATGVRPGEALGLEWSTVDLAKGEARIARTLSVLRDLGFHVGPPKTSASSRPIAFDRQTADVLHAHRKAQLQARLAWEGSWSDDFGDLVFRRPSGEPIHPNRLRRALASAAKNAGVPRLTPHGLRHSYATAALVAGVHVKKVSAQLGHGSAALTMDVYSHLLEGMMAEAAEAVAALYEVQ